MSKDNQRKQNDEYRKRTRGTWWSRSIERNQGCAVTALSLGVGLVAVVSALRGTPLTLAAPPEKEPPGCLYGPGPRVVPPQKKKGF